MKLDLEAIEKRCEKAIPGPWHHSLPKGKYYGTEVFSNNGQLHFSLWIGSESGTAKPSARELARHCPDEGDEGLEICDSHYEDMVDYNNAEFIAAARTDIPALLEFAKEAKAVLSYIRASSEFGNGEKSQEVLAKYFGGEE